MIIEHYSGGALGSDIKWQMIGREILKYPIKLVSTHYYIGRKTPFGNKELTREEFEEGITAVNRANKTLRRNPVAHMDLLSRNWLPVRESDGVFAVGNIEKGVVEGGTAWPLQMAIDNGLPAFIFDQQISRWKEWVDDYWKWCICDVPVLTKKFAGVGTRAIKENSIKAMTDIYTKSNGLWLKELK